MSRMLLVALATMLIVSCSGKKVRYSPYELLDFPPKIQERIKNGEVSLGMSPQAARYSWGAPKAVFVRESDEGAYVEEWVYTRMRVYAIRLIFTDGKLTGIISGSTVKNPLPSLDKDKKEDGNKQGSGPPQEQQ